MHKFLKFILGIKLYMFRTVPLSIIRTFSLYTQEWYKLYSLLAGSGRKLVHLFGFIIRTPTNLYSWNKPYSLIWRFADPASQYIYLSN